MFFNSPDDLVPQATNHKEDVYEYEPAGVGSCESSSGGCVALMSSGDSTEESAFLEATPSGNDVFFLTAAQLLPQDTDRAFDIYDARVCTPASPCLTPPPPAPAGCAGADVVPRAGHAWAGAARDVRHRDVLRARQPQTSASTANSKPTARKPPRSHSPGRRSSRKR